MLAISISVRDIFFTWSRNPMGGVADAYSDLHEYVSFMGEKSFFGFIRKIVANFNHWVDNYLKIKPSYHYIQEWRGR
jgi:hypothetical protein